MTDPMKGVKRETVVLHDKDGFETKEVDKAKTVEIIQEMDDGTISRTLMHRKTP